MSVTDREEKKKAKRVERRIISAMMAYTSAQPSILNAPYRRMLRVRWAHRRALLLQDSVGRIQQSIERVTLSNAGDAVLAAEAARIEGKYGSRTARIWKARRPALFGAIAGLILGTVLGMQVPKFSEHMRKERRIYEEQQIEQKMAKLTGRIEGLQVAMDITHGRDQRRISKELKETRAAIHFLDTSRSDRLSHPQTPLMKQVRMAKTYEMHIPLDLPELWKLVLTGGRTAGIPLAIVAFILLGLATLAAKRREVRRIVRSVIISYLE